MRSETAIAPAVETKSPPIGLLRWIVVLALFLLTAPLVRMADSMKVPDAYSHNVGLTQLPLAVGEWTCKQNEDLDKLSLDLLKPDDYVFREYRDPIGWPLSFLVVYGHLKQSFHSPGFCLPGGGWQIMEKSDEPVAEGGLPIEMNRFLIQRVIDGHDYKQVVLYCFVQGDNATPSLMKHNWNLLMAHFQQKRRTGALVRVIIPVVSTEDVALARAKDFITRIYPELKKRIG
ncbi:MAG TPA: EpsI family protein [Armatimonadota bacterium]|jgi:EpsI family protein